MNYKVVIPCAGLGTRVAEETQLLNKALIPLGQKAAISHIIESFDQDQEFVIVLGYKASQVREYLRHAHKQLDVTFVEVDVFEGEGSGLGRSILAAREELQCPFLFVACDAVFRGKLPAPDRNWAGFSETRVQTQQYRLLELSEGKQVLSFLDKASEPAANRVPYTGIAGIHDFGVFWDSMIDGSQDSIELGEVFGLSHLVENGIQGERIDWIDIGNSEALAQARKILDQESTAVILPKNDEAIWILDDIVVKYSRDQSFIKDRVTRTSDLLAFVPKIRLVSENMYSYDKVSGELFGNVVAQGTATVLELLEFSKVFWEPRSENLTSSEFQSLCLNFYRDKTWDRVRSFDKKYRVLNEPSTINDVACRSVRQSLEELDWNELTCGVPVRFHGDFHFQNILYRRERLPRFAFLDWRQNFSGHLFVGDIYYDFAKLLHGLIVAHEVVHRNEFEVRQESETIRLSIARPNCYSENQELFQRWAAENNYSWSRTWTLTALVFLNIAALHHHPYDRFLYHLGQLMLNSEGECDGVFTS